MATHCSILAWRIPRTEEPGGLQSMGSQRVRYGLAIEQQCSLAGKESACNAEDPGSIPGLGRSSGEGIAYTLQYSQAVLVTQLVKNPPAVRETWVQSRGRTIPWRRERLPTAVFWPGEFHGLYSPWGLKEPIS